MVVSNIYCNYEFIAYMKFHRYLNITQRCPPDIWLEPIDYDLADNARPLSTWGFYWQVNVPASDFVIRQFRNFQISSLRRAIYLLCGLPAPCVGSIASADGARTHVEISSSAH